MKWVLQGIKDISPTIGHFTPIGDLALLVAALMIGLILLRFIACQWHI